MKKYIYKVRNESFQSDAEILIERGKTADVSPTLHNMYISNTRLNSENGRLLGNRFVFVYLGSPV